MEFDIQESINVHITCALQYHQLLVFAAVGTLVLINDNMAKEKFIKYHIWNSLRPYGEASHDNVMKYFKSTGTYYYEFSNKGLTAKQSYKLSLRKTDKDIQKEYSANIYDKYYPLIVISIMLFFGLINMIIGLTGYKNGELGVWMLYIFQDLITLVLLGEAIFRKCYKTLFDWATLLVFLIGSWSFFGYSLNYFGAALPDIKYNYIYTFPGLIYKTKYWSGDLVESVYFFDPILSIGLIMLVIYLFIVLVKLISNKKLDKQIEAI